jgi:hypothetical protein
LPTYSNRGAFIFLAASSAALSLDEGVFDADALEPAIVMLHKIRIY